ncbi:MAG: cupin domain-containing protein [Fibrobacteria bacterium]
MPKTKPISEVRALIKSLGLQPHPEGGYYREIHRSAERVATRKGRRSALTTIYFLLARGQSSIFHRVLSDEVWHFYAGAPLRLWRVARDFRSREVVLLGPTPGIGSPSAREAMRHVAVIPRRDWQAAETTGDYTLVGCSVGPGFDFKDFALLRDDAKAAARLAKAFPDLSHLI